MLAYKCLRCGCIHGWTKHPRVKLVTRHIRGSGEDVWWCPGCGREHRTFDGSFMGQSQKLWKEIDPDQPETRSVIYMEDGRILVID